MDSIVIWREGVCLADDIETPHERVMEMARGATLGEFAGLISNARYLAMIAGGKATWILDGSVPLAVFAQQWKAPRLLLAPETPLLALAKPEGAPHFEFRYWSQANPERVFAALQRGEPLPDRWNTP